MKMTTAYRRRGATSPLWTPDLVDGMWKERRGCSSLRSGCRRQEYHIRSRAGMWEVQCNGFGYYENIFQTIAYRFTLEDAKNYILEMLTDPNSVHNQIEDRNHA